MFNKYFFNYLNFWLSEANKIWDNDFYKCVKEENNCNRTVIKFST